MELDGRVALVTGGASGIGLAVARRLADGGARVVIADVADGAAAAAAEQVGGRAVRLDVRDPAAWAATVAEVLAVEGRLDLAHLNAGLGTLTGDVLSLTDDEYRRVMAVNVDGVVFGTRAVLPMVAAGGGAIIATASLGGLVPMPIDPVYSASKHAVVAWVRSVAPQVAALGARICAVCPGFADTPLVGEGARELIAGMGVPLLTADAVADAVLELVVGEANGEAWFVQPGRPAGAFRFGGVPGPR